MSVYLSTSQLLESACSARFTDESYGVDSTILAKVQALLRSAESAVPRSEELRKLSHLPQTDVK